MIIESIQNKKIKERSKLITKKERDKTSLFLVEEKHLIEEALQANCLKELYILQGVENPFSFPATVCTQAVLNKLSVQVSDSKMIGVCQKPEINIEKEVSFILCDEVQDPGNLGTIIRTAYSFGFDGIYLSKNCVDVFNPKTIQSSQGALFHIPVIYCELDDQIRYLQQKDVKVFATALHSNSKWLSQIKKPAQYALLMGNEGNGVKQKYIDICDECIKIEMETFESLNVAIAASICMYTFKYMK